MGLAFFDSLIRDSSRACSGAAAAGSSSDQGEKANPGAWESPPVASYPEIPPGWTEVRRRHIGPFTTHVTYRRADGETREWGSRAHRKGASRLSRPGAATGWWAPARASWWIAVLFIIGSACFAIGPFPGFVHLVGAGADAAVFFAGSLFFTSAATLQYLETINADRGPEGTGERRRLRVLSFEPHRIDWWASAVQLLGTLFFNISTYEALQEGLSTPQENHLIWAPDVFGCACFLIAGWLAWAEVCGGAWARPRRDPEWWVAAFNLVGSLAFGVAGIASFFVPDTGDILDLAAANWTTVIGALCFLAGAVGLLVEGMRARTPAALVPAGG
jgi:hypothetical protein